MQKRKIAIYLLILLALIFLSLSFISAVAVGPSECKVLTRSDCGNDANEKIVMGISASTNAHGEKAIDGSYPYVLCCGFGTGSTTCTGTNKIIGLSAPTNAHAEIKSGTTYTGNNVCYENLDCTNYDGSCQGDYTMQVLSLSATTNAHIGAFADYTTKICCMIPGCELNSASWSDTSVVNNSNVNLNVQGTAQCDGETLSFEVWENDVFPLPDTLMDLNPPSDVVFSEGSATGTWTAQYIDDGALQGDPEYYFIATVVGSNPVIDIKSTNELSVTQLEAGICDGVNLCMNYQSSEYCGGDVCSVAVNSAPPEVDCDKVDCGCSWNSESSACSFSFASSDQSDCGNGIIDFGETCEVGDLDGKTCENSGFPDGGTISCDANCHLNTTSCIGTTGTCGNNNELNVGETCDGTNMGAFTIDDCNKFDDFTGGSLSCDIDCNIDTIGCSIGEITSTSKLGTCNYEESTNDDCDNGFLTYSWIASIGWSPENIGYDTNPDAEKYIQFNRVDENDDGKWHYDPNRLFYNGCKTGENTIACPAQIELPFFGFYSLIIAGILIAVIYKFLILNKKSKKGHK